MSSVDDHHEWLSFEDPEEDRTWLFDLTFLLSRWACIYGDGCPGIDSRADIGCCTHGAHFTDDNDRAAVEAAVATLTPEQWQFADVGRRKGILAKVGSDGWKTRIHQGGCIMLNRAGFPSGAAPTGRSTPGTTTESSTKWRSSRSTATPKPGTPSAPIWWRRSPTTGTGGTTTTTSARPPR